MINGTSSDSAAPRRVRKSEYARMRNRAPSAVSNWIRDGHLRPPALVDEDGEQLVDVALADAQLAANLDRAQQLAQETALVDEDGDQVLLTAVAEEAVAGRKSSASATTEYLAAKAREKQIDVERKERQLKAETGQWIESAAADAAFKRKLATVFTDLDSWVQTAGEDLAKEFGIDVRAATLMVRASLNRFRARQAERYAEAAAALPETLEPTPDAAA